MKIIPIHDHVLIQEAKALVADSGLKKSGIILPDSVVDEEGMNNQGKIITLPVGNHSFEEGDYVIFKRHLFDEVKVDDKKYLLGKIEDVVAVIDVK